MLPLGSHFDAFVAKAPAAVSVRAILPREWSQVIDGLTDREFGVLLKELCRRMDMKRYPKTRRGPKKKVVKEYDPAVNHVSTAQVLKERKLSISVAKNDKTHLERVSPLALMNNA